MAQTAMALVPNMAMFHFDRLVSTVYDHPQTENVPKPIKNFPDGLHQAVKDGILPKVVDVSFGEWGNPLFLIA